MALDRTLEAQYRNERGRAVRTLLNQPFLTRGHSEFDTVRTHAQWLQRFFKETAGWHLIVDARRGFARLRKVTGLGDATRPAVNNRAEARPFNARRYVLLCVIAAALERCGRQVTVRELAERVRDLTAEHGRISTFDPALQQERRALVDATRLLVSHGVLEEQDSEGDYVGASTGNVLFNVDARRLLQLLTTPKPPSESLSLDDMLTELHYVEDLDDSAGHDEVVLRARHRLMRKFFEDPVVYFDELDPHEASYLNGARTTIREWLDAAGFVVERRLEGWAAIDPDGLATDVAFPGPDSTVKHAALLLADNLTSRARDAADFSLRASRQDAESFMRQLFSDNPNWAKTYQSSDSGAARLGNEALALLESMKLVRSTHDDAVVLLPAIARFAAAVAA